MKKLIINDYSLKIGKKTLLENGDLNFRYGVINHILGKNGVGKSKLAKDFLLNVSGCVPKEISSNVSVISSCSNIPEDISAKFLIKVLSKKYKKKSINYFIDLLEIKSLPLDVLIKNLSDGQKQKLKLMTFFLEDKEIIILDEITNALDKRTVNEIHHFLNSYIKNNEDKIILNITHNLSDLNNVEGNYFLYNNKEVVQYKDKEIIIRKYIEDE